MSFSDEVYDIVRQKLAERRRRAEEECERQRREIYLKLPQVQEIDSQMMGDAVKMLELAQLAMKGKDTSAAAEQLKEKNLERQQKRAEILRQNGYAADAPTPKYTCSKCEDTGFVGTKRCECCEALLKAEAAARITGASMMSECSFDNFSLDYYSDKPMPPQNIVPREVMARVLSICKDYAENFSPKSGNLLMIGGAGLGKTHLSMAIARKVIDKGYGVAYCSAYSIFAQLQKEQYSRGEDTLAGLLDCDLLIFDDLGTEMVNQFSVAQINSIVNSRIISGKATIINTNFAIQELEKIYSERFVSRIIGSYRRLSFVGKDIRMIKSLEKNR